MSQHFEKNQDEELDALVKALHETKEKVDVMKYELDECYSKDDVDQLESDIRANLQELEKQVKERDLLRQEKKRMLEKINEIGQDGYYDNKLESMREEYRETHAQY